MAKKDVNVLTFVRLSGMMFLQFAIWGAWAVLIAGHMENLGFTGTQISYVFGTTAMLLFFTNGLGMLVGHFVSGRLHDYFAYPDGGHAWAKIFMVPIVLTLIAAILFLFLFNERKYQQDADALTNNQGDTQEE